ncbi:5'-nucleotidase, lipoprotein e(P4) family [Ferruginibacter albus]|uniref:5'-nucleotidase, lipoprotein e(P4) family n=1 Tax=Ferruginibacter albus TaxID=2875540 RepID=UPI001CC4D361|nr:5'-nucleotidase, lipoprotein e(P4) family [Ferruginibacter albus]UAY51076.1 5'-nucleotidase, lipoprotein e(P4) family [Ferruginibacter albus]
MTRYLFLSIVFTVLFCSCKTTRQLAPENTSLNGKVFTSLFQQRAAEYRALCLQSYNIARLRADEFVAQSTKPKAIITDIDETILNNSPFAVHQAYSGKEYTQSDWYDWTSRSSADTMPGAANLLNYIHSKGINIFYITNRDEKERSGTLKNLQQFGLPDADSAHLLLKQSSSSKETRRLQVMKDYEVVLLMGDNLSDFSALFDRKTEEERKQNVDASVTEFGKKFIVFPNANYGDWEGALYKYNYKLTQQQKDSVMKSVLKIY